jgi:hypothetical protein
MPRIDRQKADFARAFLHNVFSEWQRACTLHASILTRHEASAVIREEFEEFWEEVKKKEPIIGSMRKELIQVAAMCVRTVVDLKLRDPDLI